MKKITKDWLSEHAACQEARKWVNEQKETEFFILCKKAIKDKHYNWVNWVISRLFNRKQRIQYAVYAAGQVIGIFEKEFPEDKRPRSAINAAIKCIDNNTEKNRNAASAAYAAASDAASDAATATYSSPAAAATYAATYSSAAAAYASSAATSASLAAFTLSGVPTIATRFLDTEM